MAQLKRNRWNPMGLRRNHRGQLVDKYGRVMQTDWDEFEKKRLDRPDEPYPKWPKIINPLHQATYPTGQVETLVAAVLDGVEPRDFLKSIAQRAPEKFMVTSYMGQWLADADGNVTFQTFDPGMENDDPKLADEFRRIKKFDIVEHLRYWKEFSKEIDICDIGYWLDDGSYVPPETEYRHEERQRRGLGEADEPLPPPPGSAREFIKKLPRPKHAYVVDIPEWEDIEDWHRTAFVEMVQELGADWEQDEDTGHWTTDLEIQDFEPNEMRLEYGREEWVVYEDENVARAAAIAEARRNIEEGLFNQDFLEHYINVDRLKRDLRSDVYDSAYNDFHENYSDDEAKRDFFLERGDLEEDECYGTETDEDGDEQQVELPIEGDLASKIESLSESYIESQVDERLEDPIAYLQEIFGDEDGMKQAMEIGGIDAEQAASDAVDADGVGHFLSSYDGNETDLPGGAVAFRHN